MKSVLLVALSLLLGACGQQPQEDKIKSFIQEMNASENYDMVVVKAYAGPDGESVVVYDQQSYCPEFDCRYRAYNLKDYKPGNAFDVYNTVVVEDGRELWYGRQDGVLYESKNNSQKDLEKVGRYIEDQKLDGLASRLGADYGLSENRSLEIAKLVSQFKNLKSKRNITNKEMDHFSHKLLGLSYEKVKNALGEYIQGTPENFELLIHNASKINNVDPEHMKEIMGELILKN